MVAFARARTRSLLSKLWPVGTELNKSVNLDDSNKKNLHQRQCSQKRQFLNAIKNGGVWFS